jgi:hypothetical protein
MSTPEEKERASARKAKILARGGQRLQLVRGETDHVDAVPEPEMQQVLKQHEQEIAAMKLEPTEKSEEDVLSSVLEQTMRQISGERMPAIESVQLATSLATSAPAPAATAAGQTKAPATTIAAAPKPAAAPSTAPLLLERVRVVKLTGRVYLLRDVLLTAGPVLLGLVLALLALGCGWISVTYDGGRLGPLVRLLRSAVLGSPAGIASGIGGGSDLGIGSARGGDILLQQALDKLQGSTSDTLHATAASLSSTAYARLAPPVPLLTAIGNDRCDAFSGVLSGSGWFSVQSYALLSLIAWHAAINKGADMLVKAAGGQVQAQGGMLQGAVSLLQSFGGGRPGSARSVLLGYLPSILSLTTATGTAFRQATLSILAFVLAISAYAVLNGLRLSWAASVQAEACW